MSIQIQINPSLESRLREKANNKGMALNQFISQFLENTFPNTSTLQPTVSEREAVLLQQINLDIPAENWELYLNLKEKRQNNTLSPKEKERLIGLTEEIEKANAKRITVLAELAQLRNVSIRILMEQLGLAVNHE
jgi:HicB family